ncbi:protease modulator HflC [bacterium]|nr:protease modulator HflC [bacterium]
MKRKLIVAFIVAGFFILLVSSILFQVEETQFAIITQFGKPVRVISTAGLKLKWPDPIQSVRRFDRRLLLFDPEPSEFLTQDKKNVLVDSYMGWRISEPLKFLESVKERSVAEVFLADIASAAMGAALGNYSLSALVSTDPQQNKVDQIMEQVSSKCREKAAADYGIKILEVRLKRLNLPEQNKESVFERMRTERERMAKKYRSEGEEEAIKIRAEADKKCRTTLSEAYEKAQIIIGEGDAEATRIYASAFNRDPRFYKLVRTLESYGKFLNEKTTVVLSTDSELLELLTEGKFKE